MAITFGQWQHKGTVIPSGANNNPQQPSVIYEGNAKILSGTVFKMWYNKYDGTQANLNYAESTDGITWTLYVSNPLISGQGFAKVYKSGGTYYLYSSPIAFNAINVYTSSDGLAWTLQKSNAIVPGVGGAWDRGATVQLNVIDIIGGTWYGYYAGNSSLGNTSWAMGLATASDGINWTKGGSNPVITFEGPSNFDWHKIGNFYYGWSQVLLPNNPYATSGLVNAGFPSDILRFKSRSVTGPFTPLTTPVFERTQSSEGAPGPSNPNGQVADPCIVSDGTNLWIYFTATPNGNAVGPWTINAAEAPNTTFAQLIQTYEGIQSFPFYTLAGLALTNQVVATDNAQRTNENPISAGGNWLSGSASIANCQLLNNQITGTSITKAGEMYWSTAVSNDQWASATLVQAVEASSQFGVVLRGATASWTEYRVLWQGIAGQSGTVVMQAVVAGTVHTLVNSAGFTFNNGDTMTVVINGNVIYMYRNGFLLTSFTDASNFVTSGKVGVIAYGGSTTATDVGISAWSGGSLAATPSVVSTSGCGLLLGVG